MTQRLNKTVLIGRLAGEPQVHYTQRGVPFAVLHIYSCRSQDTPGGLKKTVLHRVIAWDRLGLICSKTLRKGVLLCIEGSVQRGLVRKSHGSVQETTEIVARTVKMLDRGLPRSGSTQAELFSNFEKKQLKCTSTL